MEEMIIPISWLNDFVFCPISIYNHQLYSNTEEIVFSASPQQKGKTAHKYIDNKKSSNKILYSIYVYSEYFWIYGKIDKYDVENKTLIERKNNIFQLYRGYLYQVWAQYFAMIEMGYEIDKIVIQNHSKNENRILNLPSDNDKLELLNHIKNIRRFDINQKININPNKCSHCIYVSVCDKYNSENVYS